MGDTETYKAAIEVKDRRIDELEREVEEREKIIELYLDLHGNWAADENYSMEKNKQFVHTAKMIKQKLRAENEKFKKQVEKHKTDIATGWIRDLAQREADLKEALGYINQQCQLHCYDQNGEIIRPTEWVTKRIVETAKAALAQTENKTDGGG